MKRSILLFALLLTGCGDIDFAIGPGMADFSAPLCGDYHLIRSSAHQIQVSPMGYGSSTPIIQVKVVDLGHDDRFVIAKQNVLRRRSPDNPQDTYMEPDPGNFQFWILDSMKPQVYGPFTRETFDAKRRELGVPDTITMKDVYTYRPQNKPSERTR